MSDHRTIHLTPQSKKVIAIIDTKDKPEVEYDKAYYWYDNISIHETQGGCSGYVLDGLYTEYYVPGNDMLSSGQFKNGLKDGTWTTWFQNGKIGEQSIWDNGRLTGKKCTYNSSGEHVMTESYKNGLLHGKKIVYTDKKEQVFHYKKGLLQNKTRKPNTVRDFVNSLAKNKKNVVEVKDNKAKPKKNEPNKSKNNKALSTNAMQKKRNETKKPGIWRNIKSIL
ncbi:MAG: hypothetical protein EHM20_10830 [Alphaproteobacteria bacterium]|nr:MAG: hypothetical protein EHM20_10830 [Alphaproteobacteria bacterium]